MILIVVTVTVVHSDEEEAEEASEDKDKDSLSSADSSRNPTPKLSSKSAKTIDLGAAANYGKSDITNSSAPPSSVTQVSTSVASTSEAGNPDLVDLLFGPSDSLATSPSFQASTVSVAPIQSDGFFADFASAPPGGGSITGTENNNGKRLANMLHNLLNICFSQE